MESDMKSTCNVYVVQLIDRETRKIVVDAHATFGSRLEAWLFADRNELEWRTRGWAAVVLTRKFLAKDKR
jgi:hypothetical protein